MEGSVLKESALKDSAVEISSRNFLKDSELQEDSVPEDPYENTSVSLSERNDAERFLRALSLEAPSLSEDHCESPVTHSMSLS